ncbi:hypothetical protein [Sphingomonas sp. Leaf25]|uniref:hypothetical protein n=1 Tax=Sphingomonas sp. Leaf25 TaxID=1735692 RepID=UPI000AE390B6|nr:hypothetical protein [Sphingomonas sp. Leaf25]
MFATKSDFAGTASTRVRRPTKAFEAALDRLFGERVRDDGAFGVDLWCALAGVDWRNQHGETICYSHRGAGDVVAWVREDGDYLDWYASGEAGEVADRISDPLADAGWPWSIPVLIGSKTARS